LGGAISLALVLNHPECVGGLALIAPLTHPLARVPTPRALVIQSSWRRKIVAWTIAPFAGQETLAIVFRPDKPPVDFTTKGGGLLVLRPKDFIGASEDVIGMDLPRMIERYSSLRPLRTH
jgi:pimeloyl-ACP methyl ester carboxylesterase